MKLRNPFSRLTLFEWILWGVSLTVVTLSFLLSPEKDYLTLAASLIGVTALIFISKGMAFGQLIAIVFAISYGAVSFYFRYYGEMITYFCLSVPTSIISLISWLKHPYKDEDEVEVSRVGKKLVLILALSTVVVTVAFYFILRALGTANLIVSTASVASSFVAASLTYLRSPYYALGYGVNDIILIVLWVLATIEDVAYLPMIFCFVMFLFNDLYGFINWHRIRRRQMADGDGKGEKAT